MNMQFTKRWACFSVVVMLAFLATTLGYSETTQTPQSVVEKYCSLDAQGANFSASNPNAKAIFELLINEDEAGYDTSVIIQSYHVGKSTIGKNGAYVEVTYDDLGLLSAGQLNRQKRSETVIFHLTKVGTAWKIDGLRILSHISKGWMLSEMRRGLSPDQIRVSETIKELSQW
jgi:hypothetical protein